MQNSILYITSFIVKKDRDLLKWFFISHEIAYFVCFDLFFFLQIQFLNIYDEAYKNVQAYLCIYLMYIYVCVCMRKKEWELCL